MEASRKAPGWQMERLHSPHRKEDTSHGEFAQHNISDACSDAPAIVSVQRQMPLFAADRRHGRFAQNTPYDNSLNHGQNQFQQFRKSLALIGRGNCLDDSSREILSSELQISKSMLIFCCIREFSYPLVSGIFKR